MAAYRFAYEASQPVAKVKAQKKPAYLDFIRRLPCVVTARAGVEAAHVSFANLAKGHTGRGKGTKAHDRWVLPLSPEEHRKQHSMNEQEYWRSVGIDPHELCLVLWGLWCDLRHDAEPFCLNALRLARPLFKPNQSEGVNT
ncbi:DUF968 domain-containing protein [Rhizobium sp. CFBP 8762]|uniref:DUF968 domain-containing protein n=1 Tax=Rhizobium sp. CFBP 8762 TaxID=2775279 RepID=UPI00177E20EA|nr:DUF968 domain-containing protein [Rhizobium sp. CFBP 8762]MBD8556341.1 DUF968 domain-containing protein [Rhizobium sp. CFBP 8762]